MASVLNAPHFQDEAAAYAKIESLVWPNGAVCPHCQRTDRMKLMLGNATRPGLYKCYACRKQSRVTVGTVFESSHIKLHVWLQAAYLMCSSKKGISSNQLALVLGLTVKSAWFMSRRLRGAMTAGTLPPMGCEGETVEAERVTLFYNQRGNAEQHIKEGKNAIIWTRLSCRRFDANAVRLQLHALAYNLANFLRTLTLPEAVSHWSMTTLRDRLVKIGAKIVRHGRSITFQMAEVIVSRGLFQEILDAIATLRPLPAVRC
jgi:transposase-like protein